MIEWQCNDRMTLKCKMKKEWLKWHCPRGSIQSGANVARGLSVPSFHCHSVIPDSFQSFQCHLSHSLVIPSFSGLIYFGTKGVLLPQTPFVPCQNVFCISFHIILVIPLSFHHSFVIPSFIRFILAQCVLLPQTPLCRAKMSFASHSMSFQCHSTHSG